MSSTESAPLLAFGAHPDDIEFGCGGVIARETQTGRPAHCVVCSLGEAATHGTPEQRAGESRRAAELLGSGIEFLELDGDAHLELRVAHTVKLAEVIRRIRPSVILAPTCIDNQHPDHARLGQLVRDAARIARFGGMKELIDQQAHEITQLFFYAITPDGEPRDSNPILIDISAPHVVSAWTAAMEAHMTQAQTRNYVDLQLTRARVHGSRAGVEFAMALFPNDPMVFQSLAETGRGARHF